MGTTEGVRISLESDGEVDGYVEWCSTVDDGRGGVPGGTITGLIDKASSKGITVVAEVVVHQFVLLVPFPIHPGTDVVPSNPGSVEKKHTKLSAQSSSSEHPPSHLPQGFSLLQGSSVGYSSGMGSLSCRTPTVHQSVVVISWPEQPGIEPKPGLSPIRPL
jgi:hypothetical protein